MKDTSERPSTVPKEAVWNGSQNEWELGEKNEAGNYIGEWKWWLAPKGHLCCHSFFDENGTMISFKRFHPNGEVSRYGSFENGVQIEDVYLKSTEATTEIFAYGNTDENVYKAVKREGVPVSFDYYDKDGNHLNPTIEKRVLIEETEIPGEEIEKIKKQIHTKGLSYLGKQIDASFYNETIIPLLEEKERGLKIQFTDIPMITTNVVRNALDNKRDLVYHKGDLNIPNLYCLSELGIGVLIIDGDLKVDETTAIVDNPMEMVIVTGNVSTNNLTTSGFLFTFGNLEVKQSLLGDYNDGSAFIAGNISAGLFYPEEYFFEVLGNIDFTYAFGNSWRLNQNMNPEAFNWNERRLSELTEKLHENIVSTADFSQNKGLLEKPCSEEGLFEFIDNYEFMVYVQAGKPIFKK